MRDKKSKNKGNDMLALVTPTLFRKYGGKDGAPAFVNSHISKSRCGAPGRSFVALRMTTFDS
jgi:hypothetical protein